MQGTFTYAEPICINIFIHILKRTIGG
jgi:hypothetical protein